jgi:hypothetical protein
VGCFTRSDARFPIDGFARHPREFYPPVAS